MVTLSLRDGMMKGMKAARSNHVDIILSYMSKKMQDKVVDFIQLFLFQLSEL